MDYYATLGISKNASQDDVKQAFKKLALQHHPDKGGDEKQFAKISEAYETLKDVEKRYAYDNPKHFIFETEDKKSWFNDQFFFNHKRNQNIKISVSIDFAEQFTGAEKTITYLLPSGQPRDVTVKIPKGINHGQSLKLNGLGDNTNPYTEPGTLILKIEVNKDLIWKRDGNDITCTKKINAFDLILGTKTNIKLPTGKEFAINIKPGTQPNTVLSIPNYGIPQLGTSFVGNVFIKLECVIPNIDNTEMLDAIRKLKMKHDNKK